MSHRNLKNLPEPSLPEHELIADSAPIPELSAGFKSRVMAECGTSIASAQRSFRLKVAGTTAGLCCLGLLLYLSVPLEPNAIDGMVHESQPQPAAPVYVPSTTSGTSRLPISSSPSKLTIDKPTPNAGSDTENQQMNQIIDELSGRKKMFDTETLLNL